MPKAHQWFVPEDISMSRIELGGDKGKTDNDGRNDGCHCG